MLIQCGKCGEKLKVDENTLGSGHRIVLCSKCGTKNRVPLIASTPPKPTGPANKPATEGPQDNELGWIVIHDEVTKARIYPLMPGKNIIGRKCETTPPEVNLAIETEDKYMSRNHCVIEVLQAKNGMTDFILSDSGSRNGTFLNGKPQKLNTYDEIYLKDRDCVQIGRTKVVLKTLSTVKSGKNALESVTQMQYTQTVIN